MTACVGVCEQGSSVCLKWQAVFSLTVYRLSIAIGAIRFYQESGGCDLRGGRCGKPEGSAVGAHVNVLTRTPPFVMSKAAMMRSHTLTHTRTHTHTPPFR